eukprot:NODE_7246_length_796_cov_42.573551_g6637_i0.p1 GENE.NODE_7246_length_796_cov_42.573551_g6637_i0~~NODE_7246_length_796_cov_42.573551_g6637_i0.p1  ORF type:complete len:233 (-),score=42.94 NODE_7246_length_796_cov_42.573551_g6637_i0:98-739(-)
MSFRTMKEELLALEEIKGNLTENEYQTQRSRILGFQGTPVTKVSNGYHRSYTPSLTASSNLVRSVVSPPQYYNPSSTYGVRSRSAGRTFGNSSIGYRSQTPSVISYSTQSRSSVGSYYSITPGGIVDDDWLSITINTLKRKLEQRYHSTQTAFRALDTRKVGAIDVDELAKRLVNFNLGVTDHQLSLVAGALDADRDGKVTYYDFVQAMRAFV